MPLFKRRNDKKAQASPQRTPELGKARVRLPSQNSDVSSVSGSDIPNGDPVAGSYESTASLEAWGKRPRSLLLQPGMCQDPDTADWVMNTDPLKPQTPMLTSSRLSKTMAEVLHDKEALPYFIQYMASKGGEQLIKFWLDADSFQASSWTRIRTHSLKTVQHQSLNSSPEQNSSSQETDLTTESHGVHTDSSLEGRAPPITAQDTHVDNGQQLSGLGMDSVSGASIDSLGSGMPSTGSSHDGYDVTSPGATGTDASTVPSQYAAPDSCPPLCSPHTECGTTHQPHRPADSSHVTPDDSSDAPSTLPAHHSSTSNDSGDIKDLSNSSKDSVTLTPASPQLNTQHEDSFQEKLRKSIERDAVNIYSKYISLDATHPIGISEELRNETISKICHEDGQVDPLCFARCQEFVVNVMDHVYFQGFLQSEFHCKHQIDILTGTRVHLADVLYNESALFYFMEYMEQEGAMELLQCWLAVDNFQQQLSERHGLYDGMEAQNDAMVIYEKYFSLQCTSPLGFDDKVRMEVELNICREGGPLPDCFVAPKKQVLRTIEKVYFPAFIQSELYSKYLNELINTIKLVHDLPPMGHKRTGSDASSEKSLGSVSANSEPISSKNTLLATDSSGVREKRSSLIHCKALDKILPEDMRMDSVLFNPDALWKRSQNPNKMSLGRVNEVGQFISELDPEPDHEKKKKGFFKLKKEEGQTQEEMALQIAQMIISDVNHATKGSLLDENLGS